MDAQKFIKAENVDMLWEILIDEPFKNTPKEEMNNLRQYFNNEIKLFYNTQINNRISKFNLLSLNQMFLEKIVPSQNNLQEQQQVQPQPYKAEDLQADRISQFENQLTQKKQEFENAITLKKPQVPNFSDTSKSEHIPINEMEALIAQTLAQRNFDISQINNNKTTDATNWLKPAETSVKTEKQQDNNAAIKYIKIGREQLPTFTNEIIDINEVTKQEKKISWVDESNTTSIFSKLKLKPTTEIHSTIHLETQFEILTQRVEKLENIIYKLSEQKQSQERQYH
jgi:hypothetical protein